MYNSRTRGAALMLLTAAAIVSTVPSATPANAATPISVKMNGGVMSVVGTSGADTILVTQNGSGNEATIEVFGGQIATGPGCSPTGSTGRKARCAQVSQLSASAAAGDDAIEARIDAVAVLSGGSGRDVLIGGRGNDQLRAGDGDDVFLDGTIGVDKLDGGNGIDDCAADEVLTRCER